MSESMVGALTLLGVVLIGIGAALVWLPVGIIVAGLALLVLAFLGSHARRASKEGEG